MLTLKLPIGTFTMYFNGIMGSMGSHYHWYLFSHSIMSKPFFLFQEPRSLFLTAQPNLLLKLDPPFALGALLNFYRILSSSVFLGSHCCDAVILRPQNSPCP